MKVLVTAFKPFNNLNNNYASEVLKYIDGVDKLIIDVVYDQCYFDIVKSANIDDYDLVVALGEARSRNELTLESRAINLSSCRLQDNNQIVKNEEIIDDSFPTYLYTKVDIDKCKDVIKISLDAGKFVCNNLYFHLLMNHQSKSIFIHVPNCFDEEDEYKKNAKKINEIISIITR